MGVHEYEPRITIHEPRVMIEVAQNFEQVAVSFSPLFLIAPGLAAVVIGLFVWLGGLGCRRLLTAIAGAIVASFCGFFIIGRNVIAVVLMAASAAVIAIIFESIFIKILAAALAAVLAFAVLARPYIGNPQTLQLKQDQTLTHAEALGFKQTLQAIKAYSSDFRTEVKKVCSQLPIISWVIIAALAAIAVLAASMLWRLTSALCWATLGTILIFIGMILLLLYKAALPITSIFSRTYFYTAVFAAMIAFGTTEQLMLCPHAERFLKRRKQTLKDRKKSEEKLLSWRNR